MPIPRIAVAQAPYLRDVEAAVDRALAHMRHAASRGVDIVVFPEWFMGLNPVEVIPNRYLERISQVARELNVTIVTGSLRALEPQTGKKQQRGVVIERDGTLVGSQAKLTFQPTERPWFEPGTSISAIPTRWGRIVILLGLDVLDPDIFAQARALRPDLLVLAISPRTQTEKMHLHELAVSWSVELQATVVLAPLIGRFSGASYCGGALIAHSGRIVSLAEDHETVLVAGDPDAPLIQLGVTDVSCYVPLTPPLFDRPIDPKEAIGPEGERRVFLDWGALRAPDLLAAGHEILALSHDNPRWVSLAPARAEASHDLRQLLEEGAAGAFAYPGLDRIFPWDSSFRDIGRILSLYRRPLVVHSGPGPAPLRFDQPALWDEFLHEFATIPFILLHMGRRSPYLEEALVLAERHPQVVLETSGAPTTAIREAIDSFGMQRVIFGSGGLACDFTLEWEKMESIASQVTAETFEAVINGNGRALFFDSSDAVRQSPTRDRVISLKRLS